MKGFKIALGILCCAIVVLCVLLGYALDIIPKVQVCTEEDAYFANTVPDMPLTTESTTTTTYTTSHTTTTTTATRATLSYEEYKESVQKLIKALSVNAGSKEMQKSAQMLVSELEVTENKELYELLSQVCSYSGSDIKSLAEKCGVDVKTAKQAAVACFAAAEQKDNTAVLSFVGDCTFAYYNELGGAKRFPYIYEKSGSITYPFDNVRGVFSADEITAVNFEGTLTESTVHADKQFYFRGKPEYAKILSGSSVECANLANNHSLDYFERGFEDTVKALESERVGAFWAAEPYVGSIRTESGTVSVVMLSVSSIDVKNKSKFAELKKQIKRYEAPNTIVAVNLHWGVERAVKPSSWQVETAHELVDAGADLIVGHHPHILQGIEKYNGVYIAYSLGNFAFSGNSKAAYPETIIFRAIFDIDSGEAGQCRISAVPCYITSTETDVNNFKPSLQYGEKGQEVIDLVLSRSAMLPYGITELSWHEIV